MATGPEIGRIARRMVAWAAVVVAVVAMYAAAASAANLNQKYATLQIQGTVSTNWTIPTKTRDSDCVTTIKHGNGHDIVSYNSKGHHAVVTIVDSGGNGTISFQPQEFDLATLTHLAPDFPLALDQRTGYVETDFESSGAVGCDPPPPSEFADVSGCGSAKITWMAKPLDNAGDFYPNFYPFVPARLDLHCPFYDVWTDPNPSQAKTHFPVKELRHILSKRNGKVIIHGSERFSSPVDATHDWLANTTVTWKAILIRSHYQPELPPLPKPPTPHH